MISTHDFTIKLHVKSYVKIMKKLYRKSEQNEKEQEYPNNYWKYHELNFSNAFSMDVYFSFKSYAI